ncbi:MAG: hypothetical protein HKO94_08430 [Flavobacteriaceae bacterium]|nr:hypothetical protein [Flavobacteriaceae bacterium]
MKQSYTENDLIRFLYHETSKLEDEGIAFQLEDEQEYNESFKDLLMAKQILNSLVVAPSQTCVNRILLQSRKRDLLSA